VLCFVIKLSSRPEGEIFEHVVLIKISRFARNDIIAVLFRKRSTSEYKVEIKRKGRDLDEDLQDEF